MQEQDIAPGNFLNVEKSHDAGNVAEYFDTYYPVFPYRIPARNFI